MKGLGIMKKGFTLAEVLITMTIIGIVFALTIPSIISNSNTHQYISGLNKAILALDQAASLKNPLKSSKSLSKMTTPLDVLKYFATQMNVTTPATTISCATSKVPTSSAITSGGVCSFTTADGMEFWIVKDKPEGVNHICAGKNGYPATTTSGSVNCASNTSVKYDTPATSKCSDTTPCMLIVDVNGKKKPNKMTTSTDSPLDRFAILIAGKNGKNIIPAGVAADIIHE